MGMGLAYIIISLLYIFEVLFTIFAQPVSHTDHVHEYVEFHGDYVTLLSPIAGGYLMMYMFLRK